MDFCSVGDKESYISCKRMINKNNGFFKSSKQRNFVIKRFKHIANVPGGRSLDDRRQDSAQYYGVPLSSEEYVETSTGYYSWASYGQRSQVPVLLVFVYDSYGISRHYKVGGNGNLRDGWAPNPAKCKLIWQRPADAVLPDFDEEEKLKKSAEKTSDWLGLEGQKIEVTAKITRAKSIGYSQFGEMFLTVLEDSLGNIVNVWKDLGEVGSTLKVRGTIKKLDDFQGKKQTTLTRVKIVD